MRSQSVTPTRSQGSPRDSNAQRDKLMEQADSLVDAAKAMTPESFQRHAKRRADRLGGDDGIDRFERQRRATRLGKWVDNKTGMYHFRGQFDPELGARLFEALEAEIEARYHTGKARPLSERPSNDRLAAESLVDLVSSAGRDRRPNRPELSLLVDYQTLRDGLHDHSTCETAQGADLAPETARRLCCDAGIVPIVMGGPSQPLDVGRTSRTATPAQRRAVRAAHPTCAIDGCEVRFAYCAIHHIIHWIHGGHTDLDNLVPLCNKHHHQVHEGRWTITLNPDRTTTLTAPATHSHREPEPPAPTSDAAPPSPPAPPTPRSKNEPIPGLDPTQTPITTNAP